MVYVQKRKYTLVRRGNDVVSIFPVANTIRSTDATTIAAPSLAGAKFGVSSLRSRSTGERE